MGYSVEIRRTAYDGKFAQYLWRTTLGGEGFVSVDLGAGVFRPCDAGGTPVGAMRLNRSVGMVENADPEMKENFLVVVSSVLKKWTAEEPPMTAHRYFG
ncbi:hypothetical protein GCM10010174_03380 [Kutzneria viridogrisea]